MAMAYLPLTLLVVSSSGMVQAFPTSTTTHQSGQINTTSPPRATTTSAPPGKSSVVASSEKLIQIVLDVNCFDVNMSDYESVSKALRVVFGHRMNTNLFSLDVNALSCGSLVVDVDIVIEDSEISAGQLTETIVALLDGSDSVPVYGINARAISASINGKIITRDAATDSSKLCAFYIELFGDCIDGMTCIILGGVPTCQITSNIIADVDNVEDDQTTTILLGTLIPGLSFIVTAAGIYIAWKTYKQNRNQQQMLHKKTCAHLDKDDVHVRTNDDRPYITGCVVLPRDKLVLVDWMNGNVQLADLTRGNVIAQLKLAQGIWDITQVTSTQVAVTSPDEQTIYFVKVGYIATCIWGHTLKLDRKVEVKGQCRGIARINDNLVVSYEKPLKVEIISMEGKFLRTVVTEDKGRQLFTSPWYIAVLKDQQTIYISDWGRDTVTRVDLAGRVTYKNDKLREPHGLTVDTAGRVQATYKDVKLSEPHGLTVDTAGTVYVCGWRSNNVLQLTAGLTEGRQLLQQSDGVEYPGSVCYCETTDRLYVGMRYSDVVKVFQMK